MPVHKWSFFPISFHQRRINVGPKKQSSEYQAYACGYFYRPPRSWKKCPICGQTLTTWPVAKQNELSNDVPGIPELARHDTKQKADRPLHLTKGFDRCRRLLYAVNSAPLAVSTDAGRASIFSFQYKIHTHNILYTYYKVQLHTFHTLRILRQIYYLCIYPKIFFVLLFPEQKSYQSSKFQAI